MAKYRYEMFGNMTYGEEMTYEELIEHEQNLIAGMSDFLSEMGASHIDFRPLGDALYVQCVFDDQDARNFEDVCEAAARLAGDHMEGRLLFFGRDLRRLYCFFMADGAWQGGRLNMPTPHEGLEQVPPEMQYRTSKNRNK
jgi:hypothetical protein